MLDTDPMLDTALWTDGIENWDWWTCGACGAGECCDCIACVVGDAIVVACWAFPSTLVMEPPGAVGGTLLPTAWVFFGGDGC